MNDKRLELGRRRSGWLLSGGLLIGAAIAAGVLTGFQEDSLASINGSPVDRKEFVLLLSQERAKSAQYFKNKYGAPVDETFWTTDFEGVTPADYAKRAALDRLVEYRVEQQLALSRGLEAPASYGQFLDRLQAENERRGAALRSGSPIYGPTRYSEWSYYDYVHSNMLIQLKEKMKAAELAITEDEVRQVYEQKKETRYRLPDQVTVHVMSFPLTERGRAQQALSLLTSGESFGEVRSGLAAYALKRKTDGESVVLGGAGTEDMPEAEEKLLQTALKLRTGEAVRIDFAGYCSVIQLAGRSAADYLPYDDVKEAIGYELANARFDTYIARLKSEAKIEINESNLRSVKVNE